MTQPAIFISYSHRDEKEKKQLLSQLRVLRQAGLVEIWSDDQIDPGDDWEDEINRAIVGAEVAVLFVSANFLTSDFIQTEIIPKLLDRKRNEKLVILPVIAKACAWPTIEWLRTISVWPRDGRPIWGEGESRVNQELATIAEEIAVIVTKRGLDIKSPSLLDSHKEERYLDAAMPQQVVVGKETELLIMIRLPESEGLRKLLGGDVQFQAQPEDVRNKKFEAEFPVDVRGKVNSSELWIDIETTDFTLPEKRKKIRVEPGKDTEPCIFLLTPTKSGTLRVLIQLFLVKHELLLASGFLKINGHSKVSEGIQAVKALISLSLGVFGFVSTPTAVVSDDGLSNSEWLADRGPEAIDEGWLEKSMVLEDDLPDWLFEVQDEDQPLFDTQDITIDEDLDIDQSELPDWLTNVQMQENDEPFEPSKPNHENL